MDRVSVVTDIRQANQNAARENRTLFDKHGSCVINLMSAPGAGKTSVLEATIREIAPSYKVAVIEGDLETTFDSDRIRALGVEAHQITTGSVCHLDARMVAKALASFPTDGVDLLVIENVGNLVCPAEFNLGEDLRVMVYSVVEGAEKPKKYPLMFHTSDVVLLNKIDLLPYSGVALSELLRNVVEVNPRAAIFPISCRTGQGLEGWIAWLMNELKSRRSEALSISKT
ncbi:MAG TPA: hydrogenase nickel incorporation protein HypB [Bryobacteraceae bacterium]|nr:hydrogenase nickel incorporation protein HypB [Bryobacteraceae bacterium]